MTPSTTTTKQKKVKAPSVNEEIKAFNLATLTLKTKWMQLQSKLHEFLQSDKSTTISTAFDINRVEEHTNAFAELARLFDEERQLGRETIQGTLELWENVVRLNSKQFSLIGSGYIFIGIMLANGDRYNTLRVMIEMMKMGETSPKLSLATLSLAIELEEIEMYSKIRKLVSLNMVTGVFSSWLQALDYNLRVRTCRTTNEMDTVCSEIYNMLASLLNEKPKTYALSYTEIALRSALVYAAKQPSARIQLIGDPLYHLHRCYDIAYNGLHGFFSDSVLSNGPLRLFTDEKPSLLFDKCFLFHLYCNVTGRYINELFDCGMIADAEHRHVAYFKFTLFSAFPYRLLSAVNSFYLMRQVVTFKREILEHISEWIQKLCSIEYDWILQQEQTYARALIKQFAHSNYKELLNCQNLTFINQFGRQELVKLLFTDAKKVRQFIPFCYAANLLRSTCYFFTHSVEGKRVTAAKKQDLIKDVLQVCKSVENTCRAHWLLLRQLFRLQLQPAQFSWINTPAVRQMSRSKRFASLTDDEINKYIMDAYTEYKYFQHLFYVTWRRQCGTYVAANVEQAMKQTRPYHLAMLFSESMSISLRSAMRIRETERLQVDRLTTELQSKSLEKELESLSITDDKKNVKMAVNKKVPLFSTGFFDGSKPFRDFISELPSDITVFEFSFDSNDILWLIRFHRDHEPFSIPLCYVKNAGSIGDSNSSDPLFDRLQRILKESEESTTAKEMIAKDFWLKRRGLNTEMEELVTEMQNQFLGKLWPLCRAFGPDAAKSSSAFKVQEEIKKLGFALPSAMILTHLIDQINKDEWMELIRLMAEREKTIDMELLEQIKFSTLQIRMGSKKRRCAGEAYTFIVLPPSLSTIPWECMPVFQDSLVSRIPSVYTLSALLVKHKKMPKPVNARNSYYVLNPTGNLPATQERLEGFVSKMDWKGVVGTIPQKEDVMKALKSQDMYVFLGHGSGRKYIGTSREFKTLDCNSVCLLMGCSSVEIIQEGRDFDGRSCVYDFMLAHCPCLVGCLWMVTDGEADRFFMELMRFCFEELQIEANEKQKKLESGRKDGKTKTSEEKRTDDAYRFIMRGIAKARHACKLPYLTGGSVVSYGLPTFARF